MELLSVILYIAIILISVVGFSIAFYIRWSKHQKKKHMTCPMDTECDSVVNSEYSYFLGVPVEFIGMTYYASIAVMYSYFLAVQVEVHPFLIFGVLASTAAAVMFSAYLTAVQAWVLKMWCSWCLTSAGLCVLIFGATLTASGAGIIELLEIHSPYLLLTYIVGLALGVGGVSMTMVFFIKSLADSKISQAEADTLRSAWQFIWFALAVIIISGIGLASPFYSDESVVLYFIFEIVAITFVLILSLIINFIIGPSIFKDEKNSTEINQSTEELNTGTRRVSFMLGTMLNISWFALLLISIGRLMENPLFEEYFFSEPFIPLISYLVLLILGIILSRFINHQLKQKEKALGH